MYVIAEAGVNHNGSLDTAKRLVRAAADAGANAVKFQAFRASDSISGSAPKAAYQMDTTPANQSQLEMVRQLELTPSDFEEIANEASDAGIEFMASAFDPVSVELLASMGCKRLKIASGELSNARLLYAAANTPCSLILSTGMSRLGDVEHALGVIAFALLGWSHPGSARFSEAYDDERTPELLARKVTLLHCTTEYPAPLRDTNLRAMLSLKAAFGLPVGFSDHTTGWMAAAVAAAIGATTLEKHLTLDRTMEGPDHRASLEPGEFAVMMSAIAEVESALGQYRKVVTPSERKNSSVVHKRIEASRVIRRGETLTEEALATRRPANGVSALRWFDVVGRVANRDYAVGEPIDAAILAGVELE